MKKVFIILAVLCLLSVGVSAAELSNGISFVGDAPNQVTDYEGTSGYLVEADKKDVELVFDISNDIIYGNTDLKNVKITVEYQDRGCGYFYLTYDSLSGTKTNTNYVGLYNTYNYNKFKWDSIAPTYNEIMYYKKTAEFVLNDACFSNRMKNGDFSITAKNLSQSSDFIIYSVKAELLDTNGGIDVTVDTGYEGNVFFKDRDMVGISSPEFTVDFHNNHILDKSFTATYSILDGNKEEISQIGQRLYTAGSNQDITDSLKAEDVKKFGTYYLRIQIQGTDNNIQLTKDIPFSVCVKNHEGQVNERMGLNCYFSWGRPAERAMTLIKKAGFHNIRDTYPWKGFEKEFGVYKENGTIKNYLNIAEEKGLKTLICAAYGNEIYGLTEGGTSNLQLPETDEQRKAFAEYVYQMLKLRSKNVEYVEIWNEPNSATYNPKGLSGREYMKLVKAVYQRVKPEFPNVKISAVSLASFQTQAAQEWLKEALEYDDGENIDGRGDAYKYFDVFTTHPYRTDLTTLLDVLAPYDELLEKYGAGDKEVVYTEYGHPQVTKGYNTTGINGKGTISHKTQDFQAAHILRSTLMKYGYNLAEKFYIHTFSNLDLSPNYNEHTYGMVEAHNADVPYAAKKTFLVMSNFNNLFSDIKDGQVIDNDGAREVYKFSGRDSDYTVYSFYTENTDGETYEFIPTEKINMFVDMYGNRIYPEFVDGTYNLNLTTEPIYAVIDTAPQISITKTDDGFLIEGTVVNAVNQPIGIKVFDGNEKLVGLTQTSANSYGNFEYLFIPGSTAEEYAVHIGNKSLSSRIIVCFYEATPVSIIKVESQGIEMDSMAELLTTNSFDVMIRFYDDEYIGKGELLFAMYENDTLSSANIIKSENLIKDREWYKYSLNTDEISDYSKLKIYLWSNDGKMMPLAQNISFE